MINKVILLISPEPWGKNFVSKHHYANYLAKNNTVYFLNPASSFSKNPFGTVQCVTTKIKANLIQVDYVNLLPRLNNLPKAIQKATYKKQAKQIQKACGVEKFDLVWSFDPNRYFDQTVWIAEKTIYHTVDFHPNSGFEKDIVLTSDLFIGVTELVLKDHETYRKGIEINHAADVEGFAKTTEVKLPGTNSIRAIYTGNFHRHIDYDLLRDLATANPDVDFMMIGPTTGSNLASKNTIELNELSELKQISNLHFIGTVAPEELQSYLSKCHINLVLFKKENEKIHCSPHKLMGYFYSGNVTLSNYIDAHKNTSEDIIIMAKNSVDTLTKFKTIKNNLVAYNHVDLAKKRKEFALENSYPNKIAAINALIIQHHD
ncbi:MAG: hypothetical protein GQ574_20885 [Crocinitomix sp.]|nr:hypothetical protein [Crocinitomix sp.]